MILSSRILDLDSGIASSPRIDALGKGIGEYLQGKEVDIPIKFLRERMSFQSEIR